MNGQKSMTLRLIAEQADALELIAAVDGCTQTDVIRAALDAYLAARRDDPAFREQATALADRLAQLTARGIVSTVGKRWRVQLICCGRDDGGYLADTWQEASDFREAYTSGPGVDPHGYSGNGPGHQRAGIISDDAHLDEAS